MPYFIFLFLQTNFIRSRIANRKKSRCPLAVSQLCLTNCQRLQLEGKVDTDKAVLEISEKLDIHIQQSDIAVSRRVGPTKSGKPRLIIAHTTNHSLRHRLLKESKNLHEVEERSRV